MPRVYNHERRWGFDSGLNKKIGSELRSRRKALGWNQTDMAKKMGVTQKSVSVLENGEDNVSLAKITNYLEAVHAKVIVKLPLKKNQDRIFYNLEDILSDALFT